ncbi:ABC transporter permease [Gulosibacter chungangensis]|uniref:ABC transporter permease n=1 Tax=Gulosibacter chungangensis TaxID=979746 RepID=A0A7J5BCF6_9MICO|nr:ABC transporter permease [Gulosibacter chungangensis]KAB1643647.1 ABC transporter permease [Gulosibacter chungangensis]
MQRAYASFALRRAGQAILVVLLAYVLTFVVITVLPGDPISAQLRNPENGFTEAEIQELVAYYGLNQPVLVQLAQSLGRFLIGDLGISLRTHLPVGQMIGDALPSTLVLAGTALLVAVVLAILIAIGTQVLPQKYGQGLLRAFPSLFLSIPNFIIGLLLIQFFAFSLGLFRIVEPEGPWATFFAALALGIPVSAQIAEVLIANLDREASQEYAAVARARGLGTRALFFRHLLKPASLPAVTVVALTVGELLGGSVITEIVFGRNGIGSLVERSVASQDLPSLQAIVSLAAVVFVVTNLLADLTYPLLDPRVKIAEDRAQRTAKEASYA